MININKTGKLLLGSASEFCLHKFRPSESELFNVCKKSIHILTQSAKFRDPDRSTPTNSIYKFKDTRDFTGAVISKQFEPGHIQIILADDRPDKRVVGARPKNPNISNDSSRLVQAGGDKCLIVQGPEVSGALSFQDTELKIVDTRIKLGDEKDDEIKKELLKFNETLQSRQYALSGDDKATNCTRYVHDALVHLAEKDLIEIKDKKSYDEFKNLPFDTYNYSPQGMAELVSQTFVCELEENGTNRDCSRNGWKDIRTI